MTEKPYPEWATKKQKEGMEQFRMIADEFGSFEIEFKESHDLSNHSFDAVVTWENHNAKGKREHEFWIAWDYEQTWDRYGDIVEEWQFVFSDGDTSQSMSTDMFFISLFFYMDDRLNIENDTQLPENQKQ